LKEYKKIIESHEYVNLVQRKTECDKYLELQLKNLKNLKLNNIANYILNYKYLGYFCDCENIGNCYYFPYFNCNCNCNCNNMCKLKDEIIFVYNYYHYDIDAKDMSYKLSVTGNTNGFCVKKVFK